MSNLTFDEFDAITPKAWKQKIQVDLNGLDYNKTLLWHSLEGIIIKPFYTKEDCSNLQVRLPKEPFNICQSVFIDDESIANKLATNAIARGANAIEFTAKKIFNYTKVLKNINLKTISIYFNFSFLDADFFNKLSEFSNSEKCFLNIDIIGNQVKTGNWFYNLKKDHLIVDKIISKSKNTLAVNTSTYQNAGANCVQQLAYTLAHANEYLNYFGKKTSERIVFNFSIGSNYFFEIAKLRAFRILWDALLETYSFPKTEAHIFTRPSYRNKTLYDYNVNMLRTTSECMSAVFGGANTISNISYDAIFNKSNEFGERVSRNQLLILKEEASLENPQYYANGSYYIESLTNQLAEKALAIFKQIEKGGGFLKQLKEGIIQKKITEFANKEQELFDKGELILLGTNKIQNSEDKMKHNIALFPFVKKRTEKTLIQPVITKRLAEKLEQKRLEDE